MRSSEAPASAKGAPDVGLEAIDAPDLLSAGDRVTQPGAGDRATQPPPLETPRRHSKPAPLKERTTAPLVAATRATAPPPLRVSQSGRVPERAPEPESRPEDPSVVADALEQNIAWLPEEQRPELFTHLMRGEYELVLAMLRKVRAQYPRVVSIPKAIEVVERALTSRLLGEIGRLSDEIVIQPKAGKALDDSPRSTILRLGRMSSTLGELLEGCPVPKLAALRILRDLAEEGSLLVREPVRRATGLRLGVQPGAKAEPPPEATAAMPLEDEPATRPVRPRPRR